MKKIYKYFQNNLYKSPNKICIEIQNTKFTFKDIGSLVDKLEKYLSTKNKVIGILSSNSVYHYVLTLISSKYNMLLVPLDANFPIDIISRQIYLAKIDIIFFNKDYLNKIKKIKKIKINKKINFTNLTLEKKKIFKKDILINKKNFNKSYLLSFTSGSTGNPKPILFSEICKLKRALSAIKIFNVKHENNSLITTPLHHSLGMRIMIISIILGSRLTILDDYSSNNIFQIVKEKKINFTIFISNQIKQLIMNKINIRKILSLNSIISSSAGLSLESKINLMKVYKGNFFEMYGLAELGVVSCINFKNKKKFLNSVGLPVPGVKVKISNKIKGIGEIECKSKFKFNGYFNLKNQKKFYRYSYFKTGDLGFIKNKHLYFVGRKKNMLKINGVAVYPEDIENNLNKLNYVHETVVSSVSKFDEDDWLCLLYKPKNNEKNVDYKIKKYCMENLPKIHMPRYFMNIKSIPKNSLGKINRRSVKEIVMNKFE